jgi:integration host factor subunit beta
MAATGNRSRPETADHAFNKSERYFMTEATMTKADLVEEVIKVTQMPRKEAEVTVETIFESIIGALQKGDKLEIRGFGSFRTRPRRGRIGRNPKTGEQVQVPAKRIPFFKPSKELKDYVNGGNTPENLPASAQG